MAIFIQTKSMYLVYAKREKNYPIKRLATVYAVNANEAKKKYCTKFDCAMEGVFAKKMVS